MKLFLKYWLLVIVWMTVIFIGSTDLLSAEHTSRFLVPFLRWLKPDISTAAIVQTQLLLRKAAHVAEYAILAMLLWRALRLGAGWRARRSFLFIAVWFACTIFAVSDEFHQSFIASRTASLNDVVTDSLGTAIGLAVCLAIAQRDAKRLDEPLGKS
jgi:VanZ family protein